MEGAARPLAAQQGVTLTRASQNVPLTRRGDERLPTVRMVDIRTSRTFRIADGRRFTPQLDFFNIGNAATVVARNNAIGGAYLRPQEILSPRIIRAGFVLPFANTERSPPTGPRPTILSRRGVRSDDMFCDPTTGIGYLTFRLISPPGADWLRLLVHGSTVAR